MVIIGSEIYKEVPPIFSEMKTSTGEVVYSKDDILTGQTIWQSIGGQQIGTIWGLNLGLGLMIVLSLLPIGLIQFWASLEVGLWYARGLEVMQSDLIQNLRWLRMVGDIVFSIGGFSFALAALDKTGILKINKGK